MKRLSQVLIFLLIFISASPVWAIRHRRPYNGNYRITAGFDNNGSAGGCVDYGCGSRCYNNHTGTDYGLPFNTPIRASASGVVVARNDGCGNVGYFGNTCGGRCGNYVRVRHSDGTHTQYCHMKLGGLAVGNGQQVACGQVLGYSASSGSSTGNHLHHSWQPSGSREPYVGSCGRRGSQVWTQQNGYSSLPSTECENNCACSPGARDRRSCGRCGSQTRTCGSNCQWGGWSGCSGQGTCSAGSRDSRSCGRCGSQSRTCNNSCQWGGWGSCGGQGPCAAGDKDSRECGRCGSQSRSCTNSCQWGGWGNCGGQGPCAAGSTESEPCCDCGTRARRCNSSCQWDGWGGCGGPDPSPRQACDTTKPGVCADGSKRCVAGCLTCVEDTPASDELCDGLDNDCDGEVDDGSPTELGERAPDFAAGITEFALPGALNAGDRVGAWVRVENVGQETWLPEQVVLRAVAEDPNVLAALGTSSWLAYDVPARLDHEVAPGEIATFQFEVTGAAEDFDGDKVRFAISVLGQGPIMCPKPEVSIELATLHLSGELTPDQQGDSSSEDDSKGNLKTFAESGCGCSQSSSPQSNTAILLLGLMIGGLIRRRRRA